MRITERLRNKLRAAAQFWAPAFVKRALWNQEFAGGRWDGIENTPGDAVYPFVEKYCRNGAILDLGCGSGNTSCELDETKYSRYVGVDISDVAVQKATRRSAAVHRDNKNSYEQSDIETYRPRRSFDLILFRESVYYIPRGKVKAAFDRYRRHLTSNGVFVIRCYDVGQGEEIAGLISGDYEMVEKFVPPGGPAILVFR